MLEVVAFAPYPPSGASTRYRISQFQPALRSLGVQLDLMPLLDEPAFARLYEPGRVLAKSVDFGRALMRRWRQLAAAGRYDVAVVQRELWPILGEGATSRLERLQPRWVFDFDDAVFLPNVSRANRNFAWLKPRCQHSQLVAGASRVAAGNAWLAAWARSRRPERDPAEVEVIPTVVDTDAWAPRRRNAGPPRLVWIGSGSTVRYLDPLRPALMRLTRQHPGLELHVIGARFEAPELRVFEHRWSSATEIELAAACDIGLAPLDDDDWSRGKCGLKLLLYLSLGLAAVASPVGVHTEILADGANGRLAASPEAFELAIDELLQDRTHRHALGDAGRTTVEERYSLRVVAPRLAALLRTAAESSRH
ncbi:MAG: glycosyltransferase family 4 protein [Candidatus Eisenbacteria bacterium]|uniref:Glycosyltransferase family 4 protein n=1 Tax=Eiseniibacteriota bacterium TaxID=2212470 RepID=A0A849ST21_UNCEI|nr:glycosyltransferase family 4 protein [Candidatus Eisenbacteria bacterium]